jgi:hypothetical protein
MHKRSLLNLHKRNIRRIIFNFAYNDKTLGETICTLTRSEVLGLLHEPVQVSTVPNVEKGEVLVDSRGNGSFQKALRKGK